MAEMFIDFPYSNMVIRGTEGIQFPPMALVRQKFADDKIEDLTGHLLRELEQKVENKAWYRGKRICITAGSRGIPHIDGILRTLIAALKSWGAEPFIVPAMGSHGGATAEGQREMLAGYNITEESVGAPVISSMDVEQFASLPDGTPLYCDVNALHSDGIIIFNKIKPHTNFHGPHESGLAKMTAIGLAKHVGASQFHMRGYATFAERIPQTCEVFLANCPCAFGLAVVQNAYDDICCLEVVPKEKILERDRELLKVAREHMPHFKGKDMEIVIVDEIGKNISGNGYDPNVISHDVLNYQKLFIAGLTEETHHNACGLGGAEITTRRVLRDVDWNATWTNIVTSTNIETGSIPLYMNNDRDSLLVAIRTCVGVDFNSCRIVRVKNTLSLDRVWVSPAYWETIKDRDDVELLSGFREMEFDEEGFFLN